VTRVAPPIATALAPLEAEVQADVVHAYERAGCRVVRTAQSYRRGSRRSAGTPGIPDLKIYCARARLTWWHETKAATGRQRPAQRVFQQMAESCGEIYVLGGLDAAIVQLQRVGIFA